MLQIKKQIAEQIYRYILEKTSDNSMDVAQIIGLLEYPPDTTMGDLAFPCFKLSKLLRKSPVAIAEDMATSMEQCGCVSDAKAVNGYLNLTISSKYLSGAVLRQILTDGENYGKPNVGNGKTVVLDYSSPNVAKPFHIGHLGTTVIGHSLKQLHEFAGYHCIGINYLGDWGTQFGKLITAFKKWGSKEQVEEQGIDYLVDLYVKINNAIGEQEEQGNHELADLSRAEFHKMEVGDAENIDLWKWFVKISLAEYEKTYKQIGITFDSYLGESFYTDKMPAQVEKLREQGLLKIDDGASIVDLSDYNMPPCLILKKDGSTLYPTRDIAAAVYRKNTYHFDKAIYVTSAGQCLHFQQWFKVVEMMGYDWYNQLVHVPYGTVSINGAKLATRTGNVILLKDLFAASIDKVKGIIAEKNPNLVNKDEVAESIGVGAIIFYYLSNNRMKDINFVLEDALSFDGNTGPYVQYTYARTCSLLEKAGVAAEAADDYAVTDPDEADLLKTLCRFEETVLQAIREYEPSVITRFILDVAASFNRFYHNCAILTVEDEKVRRFRIGLVKAAQTVLGNAFGLICLKKTEKV